MATSILYNPVTLNEIWALGNAFQHSGADDETHGISTVNSSVGSRRPFPLQPLDDS